MRLFMGSTLSKLQAWFRLHCDGEWEHSEGIIIETLDNPGWQISISLKGTLLEYIDFTEVKIGNPEKDCLQNDYWEKPSERWMHCYKSEHLLIGQCSPEMLETTVNAFLKWFDENTDTFAWDNKVRLLINKCNSMEINQDNIPAFRELYQDILVLPNEHPKKMELMQMFYRRWNELRIKGIV